MIEPYYPNILAVDPTDCGCTECLIGEYVPSGMWAIFANAADVAAVLSGKVHNNGYETLHDLVFRTSFGDDTAVRFVKNAQEKLIELAHLIDLEEIVQKSEYY